MSKKGREKFRVYEIDPYSDDDFDEDYFDMDAISRDVQNAERDEIFEKEEKFSTRRKIERRNDMKQLYSQFDEWEEVDLRDNW